MGRAVLLEAFAADDADALLRLLPTSSEADRSSAWVGAAEHFRPRRWQAELAALDIEGAQRRTRAQAVFCLATGPPDVVRLVGGFVFGAPSDDELAVAFALRSSAWKRAFADASLQTWASEKEPGMLGPWWWDTWVRIRKCERTGLLPFDGGSVDYLVVLVRGLTFSGSIEDQFMADSDLLRGAVWALFQPAEGVQRALMGGDRHWNPANTWRAALVRLALGGHLDPARLRSEAHRAALDQRLGRNQQAWYRGLIKMLDDPALLPAPASTGAPPPGNQLQR